MREEWLRIYQTAFGHWKERAYAVAYALLPALKETAATRAERLRSGLLEAYICRDLCRHVSEEQALKAMLAESAEDLTEEERALFADGYSLLGSVYNLFGKHMEAKEAFLDSAAWERNPLQRLSEISNALFAANALSAFCAADWEELFARYRAALSPAIGISPREGFGVQQAFSKEGKLRVGYVSADFREHPVGRLVLPLFEHADRERFSLFAYFTGEADSATESFRRLSDGWREIQGFLPSEAAAQIRADEVDILVDLGGHTADNALPVFALQPAKVQISGIGYMGSSGLLEMDGFLGDVYLDAAERSPYFTEKILRLPATHFCYPAKADLPEPVLPPALSSGRVTFGCFNHFAKVTEEMLGLWREILQAAPESRLLLKSSHLDEPEMNAYAKRRLKAAGISLERVEFRGFSADYFQAYQEVDIALDTYPYTGGMTTCDALYMGVPVITRYGERHGSRFGYSLLRNLGLEELAVRESGEYVERAAALARDMELLTLLHTRLRPLMKASPLMDGRGYAAAVEKAYVALYEEKGRTR